MPKYANQKTVISKKTSFKDNDTFIQVLNDDWMEAARIIKQFNAFKLYLYFAKNQCGYSGDFSPAHAQEVLGMGKTSCDDSFATLKKLGYLKEVKKGVYEFYSSPYKEETTATAVKVEKTATAENKVIDFNQNKTALAVNEVSTATAENEKTALAVEVEKTATAENILVEDGKFIF